MSMEIARNTIKFFKIIIATQNADLGARSSQNCLITDIRPQPRER